MALIESPKMQTVKDWCEEKGLDISAYEPIAEPNKMWDEKDFLGIRKIVVKEKIKKKAAKPKGRSAKKHVEEKKVEEVPVESEKVEEEVEG